MKYVKYKNLATGEVVVGQETFRTRNNVRIRLADGTEESMGASFVKDATAKEYRDYTRKLRAKG